jgi:uncharacterized protein DUF4157
MNAVAVEPRKAAPQQSRRSDPYEREADRVAETVASGGSVAGWSFSSVPVSTPAKGDAEHARSCSCGGTCPACRRARLQRAARSEAAPATEAAPALSAPGEPLAAGARAYFEPRLGADLSGVRVHRDEEAARSADARNAHAYAYGPHLVFGAGEYSFDTARGRRLLAHELTHVIQQQSIGPRIQREDKQQAPVDVAIVLDGDAESMPAAKALAAKAVRVYSASDIATELKKVGAPIGTLFVVSHSSPSGEVKFESSIGTISWVKLADLTAAMKGALPADKTPQVIDFRGCKLGEASEELGKFRQAVGAREARAVNCWSFDNVVGPITFGGQPIKSESDLDTEDRKKNFPKALGMLIDTLKSEDGTSVKNCVLGLAAGESAGSATGLAKIRKQYFATGGYLTAEWVSPEYNHTWQEGSKCRKDLTESTTPCKLTSKKAEATTEEPGKKAEVEGRAGDAESVEATAEATPEAEPQEAAA